MKFIISAFGPFQGQPTNPTLSIVLGQNEESPPEQETTTGLKAMLAKYPINTNGEVQPSIETVCLPVSAKGVEKKLTLLYNETFSSSNDSNNNNDDEPTIIIHCGVDGSASNFKLERTAFNCMDFRVPDNEGYQPCAKPIDETAKDEEENGGGLPTSSRSNDSNSTNLTGSQINHKLYSLSGYNASPPILAHGIKPPKHSPLMDVIQRRLASDWGNELVQTSDDAGRFVCNYTLYKSLALAEHYNSLVPGAGFAGPKPPRVAAFFLHVPNFEVLKEEGQTRFLRDVVAAIYELIVGGDGKGCIGPKD